MTEGVVHLSRFRASLSRALNRKGKTLLESANLARDVPALEPLEAYFIVKELGVDTATPILRHCSPEQLQTFVDLDCWGSDALEILDLDAWLAPFAAEGPEALADAFLALDEEVQVAFLAQSLVVHDTRSEDIVETESATARMTTVDGFFMLEAGLEPDEDREVPPFVLVDALYRRDINEAFRLLTAAKWESVDVVIEQARQFRAARAEELGFPSRVDALHIFTPPAKTAARRYSPRHSVSSHLPAVYATPLNEACLLTAALARVADEATLVEIERELMELINAAVVAYEGSPRNLYATAQVARVVRDTLSLGLEVLVSPDRPLAFPRGEDAAQAAHEALAAWPLVDVFRHGHRATLPLARTASALTEDPVVRAWLDRTNEEDHPDTAEREFLRALASPHPVYAGWDAREPKKRAGFNSRQQLHAAEERLDALAGRLH